MGDAADDLTYTPVTPCRIVDTRIAGSPLSAGMNSTFLGFGGSFASQGGAASSCDLPNGVAALSLNVAAVQPLGAGFIELWAANVSRPPTGSTVNYSANDFATATGTIAPVDPSNNRFSAWSPVGVDMVVDVVGYFRRPGVTALACYQTSFASSGTNGVNKFASATTPACNSGYQVTAGSCYMTGFGYLNESRSSGDAWVCGGIAGPSVSADTVVGYATCCRIPGH